MKQRNMLGLVSVILFIALSVTMPVRAQAKDDDEWHFVVAPYMLLAGMDGTLGVEGIEVETDITDKTIMNNLQGGFNGYFAAQKGDWGFGVDVIYMALGTSGDYVNLDPSQAAFTLLAIRRLSPNVDLQFGARVNVVRARIEFKDNAPPTLAGVTAEDTKTWVDPVVGVHWKQPLGGKWLLSVPANVGGFGVASDIAVDVFPTVQYQLGERIWIGGGWRFMYMDYQTGYEDGIPIADEHPFKYDMITTGPVFGMAFRF